MVKLRLDRYIRAVIDTGEIPPPWSRKVRSDEHRSPGHAPDREGISHRETLMETVDLEDLHLELLLITALHDEAERLTSLSAPSHASMNRREPDRRGE
jgi:hypothetical protein